MLRARSAGRGSLHAVRGRADQRIPRPSPQITSAQKKDEKPRATFCELFSRIVLKCPLPNHERRRGDGAFARGRGNSQRRTQREQATPAGDRARGRRGAEADMPGNRPPSLSTYRTRFGLAGTRWGGRDWHAVVKFAEGQVAAHLATALVATAAGDGGEAAAARRPRAKERRCMCVLGECVSCLAKGQGRLARGGGEPADDSPRPAGQTGGPSPTPSCERRAACGLPAARTRRQRRRHPWRRCSCLC